ncbi:MAG: translation initiation factor IF-2 N-terminal domain-containing protein, partial [Pseudonocardia sp.]|nr:translation initiation factor IF-2 N-terminal domain-containing protein [Pseudonocardia sp.]
MAGKARVHELAKELGVTSKQVLSKLQDLGEYVKSPSSTVEAPVARKLREAMAGGSGGSDGAKSPARGRRPGAGARPTAPRSGKAPSDGGAGGAANGGVTNGGAA